MKLSIEVFNRGEDLRGKEIKEEISSLGISGISEVKTYKLYLFEGNISNDVLERIAGEILVDPIIEDFTIGVCKNRNISTLSPKVIKVFYKKGVLDVEGKVVMEALKITGIKGVRKVWKVRKYVFKTTGDISARTFRFLAAKLLYNKVIEEIKLK